MSQIVIQKISITDLATDAIVNAANSGLLAGSGVCGAIFKAAGYRQLQDACDRYGYCPTGSAVITPGFNLKAKYVIHAVGPIWQGGGQGEAELLRSAYIKSLELAVGNGCRSIGFPLISAGIYGYPLREAWSVAISACRDFTERNPESTVDVTFAVLSDSIMAAGLECLAGNRA